MNSGFLVTDAGLAAAAVATAEGPFIHITQFRVGSAYNYTPTRAQTALQGTPLYTGTPNSYSIISGDTVQIVCTMDTSIGDFTFGEVGLYLASGELFAIATFDTLQQKVRALGSTAGNIWRVRALVKLAQAAALVQVSIVNSQGILEVPSFSTLAIPSAQLGGANIAIVHQNNSAGQPVLVVRDSGSKWSLTDYNLKLSGATNDSGAAITTTTLTHPLISTLGLSGFLPRTDSKFLVQLPGGYIRQIVDYPASGQIQFDAPVPAGISGAFSIWAENSVDPQLEYAGWGDFNLVASALDKFWSTPKGPYSDVPANVSQFPLENWGANQVSLALGGETVSRANWLTMFQAVKDLAHVQGVDTTPLDALYDFTYRPNNPYFHSFETLYNQWEELEFYLPKLDATRNTYDPAYLENTLVYGGVSNEFWTGIQQYLFSFTHSSNAGMQGLLNMGHELRLNLTVTSVTNPKWTDLQNLMAAVGTLRLTNNAVTGSAGTSSRGLQQLTTSYQTMWTYSANNWTVTIEGQVAQQAGATRVIQLRVKIDNSLDGVSNLGPTPGQLNWNWYSYKPASTLFVGTPFTHPTATQIGSVSGGFLFNQTIATNINNYNLRAAAVAAGWDQVVPLLATITVNSGVVIGSNSNTTPAFDTGTPFTTGTTLSLTINSGAYIVGKGGIGRNANGPTSGADGGPAFKAQYAISVSNNGTIGGGGGGGGGGEGKGYTVTGTYSTLYYYAGGGGGGGGAGAPAGTGGAGDTTINTVNKYRYATNGGSGSLTGGGGGGQSSYGSNGPNDYMSGGYGGNGGNLGANGSAGNAGGYGAEAGFYPTPFQWYAQTSATAAGYAIQGNANITWSPAGTRLGVIS